jgi:hypothetical protein
MGVTPNQQASQKLSAGLIGHQLPVTDPSCNIERASLTMAPAQCPRAQQMVYHFGKGKSEGSKAMKDLVISIVISLLW